MGWFSFTKGVTAIALGNHSARHENGGADEISLAGLSGDPADTINESLLTTQNDIIVRGASIAERLAIGASRIVARLASGNVVAATGAQILALLTGQAGATFDWNSQNLTNTGTITANSAIWWHEYILPASAFSQGASGATTQAPNANTLGGWLLDRDVADEELNSTSHVEDDWDGASDPICEIYFEVNIDNTGGSDTDTVDIQVIFRYKGDGETAIKTQTVVDAVVVGKAAQYKQFKATATLNWDLGGNVLEAGDVVSIAAGLVAASSEVTNIILNFAEFKYHTKKPAPEV